MCNSIRVITKRTIPLQEDPIDEVLEVTSVGVTVLFPQGPSDTRDTVKELYYMDSDLAWRL